MPGRMGGCEKGRAGGGEKEVLNFDWMGLNGNT